MNHSPNFWSLLNEVFPNYRKIKGQLRSNANSSIPSWALV
ncbi:MAG: M48 family peptidase, partial [SAR202 cluster bacterium]